MRVLVTGASGFLGSHICRTLLEGHHEVFGLVRRENFDLSVPGVKYLKGSLQDKVSLLKLTQGMDAVIHTAALVSDYAPWIDFVATNIDGTSNLCEAAINNGCKSFVHISTIDVHGLPAKGATVDDDSPLKKSGYPYPDSKIAAEEIVEKMLVPTGIKVSIVRPSWIFGEGDRTFFPELIKAINTKQWVYIGSKDVKICLSYVKNLAHACVFLLENSHEPITRVLYNDFTMKWGELMTKIGESQKMRVPTTEIPARILKVVATLIEGVWKILRIKSRPLFTAFTVDFLSADINYISRRVQSMGFKRNYTQDEALNATLKSFENSP